MSPKKRYLKAILNTFVFWGASLFTLLLISGFVSYLAQSSEILSAVLALEHLQTIFVVTTGAYASYKTFRWLKQTENPYPLILEDIRTNKITDEIYQIKAVCRFQEPELGGYIYFFKISSSKVFVVYDYESQNGESQHEELSTLVIKEHLLLSCAVNSDTVVDQSFDGKVILLEASYSLNVPPKEWPKANTWLHAEWNELERIYGENK